MAEAAYKVEASNHFGEPNEDNYSGRPKQNSRGRSNRLTNAEKPNGKPKPGNLAGSNDHHLDTIA
jgi:hypothetical protein